MNYLTCPECGSPVSVGDTVCGCCGYQITVCPDCGAVYPSGQARCDVCGKVLSEEILYEKAVEDAKKVEKQIDAVKNREKTIGKIEWGLRIIGFIFEALMLVIYFLWKNQNELDAILKMSSRIDLCKGLLIIGSLFIVLSEIFSDVVKEISIPKSLANWINNNKFDYREYIRLHGTDESAQVVGSYMYSMELSEAALLIESSKTKGLVYFLYIFKSIMIVIADIPFTVIGFRIIPQLFESRFSPVDIEWMDSAAVAFLVFIVISGICQLIITCIIPKLVSKKRDEILLSAKK